MFHRARWPIKIFIKTVMSKIEKEKRIVGIMIRVYCRHKEGNRQLCDDCRELLEYAEARLSRCPFGDNKTSCRKCRVHCYRPEMREKIRAVMRYSGPRMLIYAPLEFLKHTIKG